MLIRQTLLYLPAQVLAPAVQFASILIWAYLLKPEDLGIVTLLIATQEICYAAFFGWWGFYTLRFITSHSEDGDRRGYLATESVAVPVSGLVQSLIALPVLHLVFGEAIDATTTAMCVMFMITRSFNNYNADRARAEARILLYSLVQVVGPVIGFLFGLGCIWYFGSGPRPVLAGFIVAQLIGVLLAVLMSDFLHVFGKVRIAMLKEALRFGGLQTSSQMLAIVAINAPRFIVSHFLGLAAAGIFSVGYGLGIRAASFAVTLVTAGAYPMVVKKLKTEGRDAAFAQLRQNMILVAMVVTPVALGLLGVNETIVDVLVAPEYRAITLWVLPIAALGGLFRFLRAHTSDQVFLLNLKPGFGTIIAICDLLIGVASAYLGILLWGTVGAAIGPMVSGLFSFVLSFFLSRTKFGFRAPLAAFARIGLAAGIMAGALKLVPVRHDIVMLLAQVAAGGVLYAGALMLLMRDQARQVLRAMMARRARRKPSQDGASKHI